jgi:hypothetical protein
MTIAYQSLGLTIVFYYLVIKTGIIGERPLGLINSLKLIIVTITRLRFGGLKGRHEMIDRHDSLSKNYKAYGSLAWSSYN